MAGALFRAAGTASQSASAAALTPALPTESFGNGFLIAVVFSKNNATHTTATTGWTKLGSTTNSGASFCASVFTAPTTALAPAFTWTGAAACAAQVYYYADPDIVSPTVGASSVATGSTSTHTSTGITTTGENSLVALVDVSAANTALGTPAGWTQDVSSGVGTAGGHLDEKSNGFAANGASSGSTSATGANAAWVAWQIEIKRPSAGFTTFAASTKFEGLGILGPSQQSADATKFEGLGIVATDQQSADATKFVSYAIVIDESVFRHSFGPPRLVPKWLSEPMQYERQRRFAPVVVVNVDDDMVCQFLF